MECGWNMAVVMQTAKTLSLNPCSNGMRMERKQLLHLQLPKYCLNPCSNGMRMELKNSKVMKEIIVLILVLMECGWNA